MIKLFTFEELKNKSDDDDCAACPYNSTCSRLTEEYNCAGGYFREVPDEPVKNKPYYKIWLAIEYIDEDKDIYKDVEDETIFCGDHFDTLEDAIAYRNKLIGTAPKEVKPMKINYTGPYPLLPAKEGDAGYDISSSETKKLYGNTSMSFSTGLYVAIPPGYVGKVVSRSGLAFRHNIEVGAGIIDSGYRGEIKILLHNFGDRPVEVRKGDRIAQLLILKHESPEFILVDELDNNTERGANGFGHTGIKETIHVSV